MEEQYGSQDEQARVSEAWCGKRSRGLSTGKGDKVREGILGEVRVSREGKVDEGEIQGKKGN